jgi:lycopene beta-cyclase
MDPRVILIEAAVDEVRDGPYSAHARVGGDWVSGRFVFDSRPATAEAGRPPSPSRRALTLYQSFRGIWIRSESVTVDTSAATLLDFSADDGPDLGFAYVLPIDAQSAMVMAVRMATTPDMPDPSASVPRELGEDGWRVVGEEAGVTTLATPPPQRREGARVLAIGRRGGRVRASTGYAVTRILADTDAIVGSLRSRGHPFAIPTDPYRDRILDAIWLHALASRRAELEPAFLAQFAGVPIGSVLQFLDGRSTAGHLLRVIGALPPRPFLRASVRHTLGRSPGNGTGPPPGRAPALPGAPPSDASQRRRSDP